MDILVCDEPFDLSESTGPFCPGQLASIAYDGTPGNSGLTWEQVDELQDGILILFASVFAFLVLKKVL